MLEGVIVKGIGGFYYIDTEQGVYECRARGIFRKEGIRPTVGDAVRISILDEAGKKGSLDEILPRRNELIRPRVSNVDQAVIVFAAKSPNMNLDLLDRFLLLAEEQELEILIVINKIDEDKNEDYLAAAELYRHAGYPVICASAQKGIGIEQLRHALENKISVFAGPSGVGKSSLIIEYRRGQPENSARQAYDASCGADTGFGKKLYRRFPGVYLPFAESYSIGDITGLFSGIPSVFESMPLYRLYAYQ